MLRKPRLLPKLILAFLIVLIAAISPNRINILADHNSTFPSFDRGVVVAIYDGDTIKVRFESGLERRVRLIGVDSPEIEDEREEVRFFANIAKRFAFCHLYRKNVRLSYDWEREDKYGRLLAYVWYAGDILFNEFIINEGFAYAFLKFPFKEEYRMRFVHAEKAAKKHERGLWQKEPLPTISSSEAGDHIGKCISVNFICTEVRSRDSFIFLRSQNDFSAIIPHRCLSLFSDVQSFAGRQLSVKGYLEDYKGKPQIMVLLPLQINWDMKSGVV